MDDALKNYISKKDSKTLSGASVRDYRRNAERVTEKIITDIRESKRLAASLRAAGVDHPSKD